MKKLSLVLASFALATGVSFAQSNVGVIVETGMDQTASINQIGIFNNSLINQSDKENTATVSQSNFNILYNTSSEVNQSGEANKATVKQISNGTLTGSNAIGTLKALVSQSGDRNEALQQQGPHSQQGISSAEIIQGGSENYASQNQLKYGNVAKINQSGNLNTAMQAQDSKILPEEEGSYNKAVIDQSGNDNSATQIQDGWANDVKAVQSGSNNVSMQNQADYSWKSIASVSQSGNWNEATQTQLGQLNSASIDQASNGNTATQVQTSLSGRASGYAPLNNAEISQSGGDENIAVQTQTTPGGELMNDGIIWQNGSGNEAYQTQTGGDNFGSVWQSGNNNMATVTQSMSIVQQ